LPGRKQAWVGTPFFVGYMRDIMPDKQTSLYSCFFTPAERQALASFPFDDFSSEIKLIRVLLFRLQTEEHTAEQALSLEERSILLRDIECLFSPLDSMVRTQMSSHSPMDEFDKAVQEAVEEIDRELHFLFDRGKTPEKKAPGSPAHSKGKPGAEICDRHALKHGFYSDQFTQAERRALDNVPLNDLTGEIELLRVEIHRYFEALNRAGGGLDHQTLHSFRRAVNRSADRLTNLVRSQTLLNLQTREWQKVEEILNSIPFDDDDMDEDEERDGEN